MKYINIEHERRQNNDRMQNYTILEDLKRHRELLHADKRIRK